jgi:nucleoid-associated protein YgaU
MNSQVSKTVTTQNILLSVLTVINVMLILVVIYFFLSSDESSESTSSAKTSTQKINEKSALAPIVAYSDEAAKQIAKAGRGIDKNDVDSIDNLTGQKVGVSKVNKKVTDSKITQQANISKSLETINRSLDDLGELSSKDTSYVTALDELKKEVSLQISSIKSTTKEAAVRKVKLAKVKQDDTEKSVDYFNKVDVSKVNTQLAITSARYRLKAQIAQIVSEPEDANLNKNKGVKKVDKVYLKTLETESIERANEMRTIQVAKGDSLWDIAERAYGDGYQYPRIFAANPNLTDPDKIEVGTFLRVPL